MVVKVQCLLLQIWKDVGADWLAGYGEMRQRQSTWCLSLETTDCENTSRIGRIA